MPRPLLDSVKNGHSFAASASRDRFAPFGLAFGEVSLASLGAFPLAYYGIIRGMKHTLLASKSITLKAPQAKVRRIKAVIGNRE